MSASVVEVKGRNGWVKAGLTRPGDPPGTISDNLPTGERHLYLVTCHESYTLIQRSLVGADIEVRGGEVRAIKSLGLVEEAKLTNGQEWEKLVKTDRMKRRHAMRVRHVVAR